MANSEYNRDEMVMLYDPSKNHRCNLPDLKVFNHKREVGHRTIMECEECAQRWWSYVDIADYKRNSWHKLRWYNWVLRSKIG